MWDEIDRGFSGTRSWQFERRRAAQYARHVGGRKKGHQVCVFIYIYVYIHNASAIRLEAVASRLEAIANRLEAIASRLEAIAIRLEAIAIGKKDRKKCHPIYTYRRLEIYPSLRSPRFVAGLLTLDSSSTLTRCQVQKSFLIYMIFKY